ncbi:MAG: tRNA lysidine(34) synthetase TilS [Oscillospiraceae bacterium]|nr:tRNA lysidine(34) synthetase TilS [Oscillospiraceae bacterium]
MLNKIPAFIRQYTMVEPGDTVICAVSGGADSIALLFSLYLLRDKLKINLQAAHFNHGLRGTESDRDEAFVREFCERYDIVLHVGSGQVVSGKKGLEAAAREARYAFFRTLPGKIATAHTADDNAETVLMHLIRGTGLKGLGGITPVSGQLIRPMLSVTREEVLSFLREYALSCVEDSSNAGDQFLRNRLRHSVLPLLRQENPGVSQSISATALQLRQDEAYLQFLVPEELPEIPVLRQMPSALRSRALSRFLAQNGLPECQREHIALLEQIVFSGNPSASVRLPGGLVVRRCYEKLEMGRDLPELQECILPVPANMEIPSLGIQVCTRQAESLWSEKNRFCVSVKGSLRIRSRRTGDTMALPGGSKSLKKLLINKKIPAHLRSQIPVLEDDDGIVGVYGFGADRRRIAKDFPCVEICFTENSH